MTADWDEWPQDIQDIEEKRRKDRAVTDEVMAERRQLFLEEMARIQEREQQAQEEARRAALSQAQSAGVVAAPVRRSVRVSRAGLLILVVLCLALTFPVFGYIQREAQRNLRAQWQPPGALGFNGPMWLPDTPERRQARLEHARDFFGLPDILSVRRSEFGLLLLLRPGLSKATIIAHARRVRTALSSNDYPTRGPQPWRVGVCSADIPCSIKLAASSQLGTATIIPTHRLAK